MDIFQNPFSSSDLQVSRPKVNIGNQSNFVVGAQSSSLSSSLRNTKDEYIQSTLASSGTYKRSSAVNVPLANNETVQPGKITDAMREEMRINGESWSCLGLLPIAYATFHEIYADVLIEKGILSPELEIYKEHSFQHSINPDGVFIVNPEDAFVEGFDKDSVEEVCLALEAALNASSLNMKENPHLFIKKVFLPLDYDPAKWGRTIDREEWENSREPDFSEFVKELRSDIYENFSDLQILDFSIKIDDQGKLTITDVKTERNALTTDTRTAEKMNRELTAEIKEKAEYLGLLMLSAQSINGDVLTEGTILEPFDDGARGNIKQFKHEIIINSDSDYKVVRTKDQPRHKRNELLDYLLQSAQNK
ncbi:MAG: hypothetical protein LBC74_03100 [Planctomycetaceae bacterium]|jgi:hypothetical protein|nr:hypothetical protein [Planctomycetaceae bacterium]